MAGFGRRYAPDIRDSGYLMRRMLADARAVTLPARRTWGIHRTALDQGNTGTCVGHAWRNFLRCAPIRTERGGPSAFDIYRSAVLKDTWRANNDEAQLPDGDPGLDYGTSVRAGAQAVTAFGRLKSYVWAFELQAVIEWVLTEGPVVLGTNWYSSFARPDRQGIVRIEAKARVVGGHAYLLRGVDTRRALARCANSWGDGWGLSGEFLLPFRDLDRLIPEAGEACSAVEKRPAAKAVMPKAAKAFVPPAGRAGRRRTKRRR
jgi:hypothetical protein